MAHGILFITGGIGSLGNPITLEDWHKALLLPESYNVIGWKAVPYGMSLAVLVESDAIPLSASGLTEIKPVYHREYHEDTSHAVLDRIEFEV